MRVRNHALDGLRGLAALGVLTLHVWMFTVQGAHGRDELVSLLTGELRLGVVLFFVLSGYLLAGPVGRQRAGRSPGAAPGRASRSSARRASRPPTGSRCSAPSGCWPAPGTATRSARGSCRSSPPSGRTTSASAAGKLDPPMWSLVVEVSFYAVLPLAGWLLVRARAAGADGGGLRAAWRGSGSRGARPASLLAWPETAMSTLPTFLPVFACGMAAAALAHRRVPSRRRGGRWSSRASRSCAPTRGGTTRAPA